MAEKIMLISEDKLGSHDAKWSKLATAAIANCPKIKKEREIAILLDRFGIGKNTKTLHSIGQQYGVTRERIRQIVNNGMRKIQKNCLSDDLKKAIKNIEDKVEKNGGVITFDSLAEVFGITEQVEKNAIHFCATLSDKLYLVKESKDLTQSWALKNVKIAQIKDLSTKSIAYLKKTQKVQKASSIAKEVGANENLVFAVLGTTKATMQTDKKEWGLTAWPHVNPKSIRDKSKYIMIRHGKPLHYAELTKRIGTIGTKKVTQQSVHNELIKNQEFVLVGRGIYAMRDWGYAPGVVEEVIVEVLEEAGEPLHKNEIIKRVLERRMVKESTIALNLQRSRFKRVDKAIYTLN